MLCDIYSLSYITQRIPLQRHWIKQYDFFFFWENRRKRVNLCCSNDIWNSRIDDNEEKEWRSLWLSHKDIVSVVKLNGKKEKRRWDVVGGFQLTIYSSLRGEKILSTYSGSLILILTNFRSLLRTRALSDEWRWVTTGISLSLSLPV